MQHVKPKWLSTYVYSTLVIDLGLVLGFFYFQNFQASDELIKYWGITPLVLIFVGLHAFVTLLIYPLIRKRSEWAAFVVAMIPYGLLLSAIIETSGNVNIVYRVLFIILVFMLNMVGPYLAIASAVIAWILLLFDVLSISNSIPEARVFNFVADIFVTLAAISGWYFFKRFYLSRPDKQTLGKLQSEQTKTNFILNSMTDGVVLVDNNSRVEFINPAAERMLGWPAKNAMGLYCSQIMQFYDLKKQPYHQDQEPLAKSRATKKPVRDNNVLLGKRDGSFLDVSFDATPLLDDSGQPTGGIMGIFRDITKEREEERQKAEFISTASHEMRTPVAAIEGYLALAQSPKVATIDERAKIYLEKAHASTQHLGQLFQDLLTSSKADDGRLSNHPIVLELGELLQHITEDLRFSAQKKDLEVEFIVGKDNQNSSHNTTIRPLYYVFADPDRLREVITNLFDNAVKYTSKGKITIGVTGDNRVVQFYIKDTGAGIPAQDLPHLFQKFYRVDNSETRTIGGTGLGLFICRKILELYNGRIWVTSKAGEGSTFFVNLPRLDSASAHSRMSQQQAEAKQS